MDNFEGKAKQVDLATLLAMMPIFSNFPRLHNKLKDDFHVLLGIAEGLKSEPVKFGAQCNACIKEFFAMVEADLHYYNLLDPYKEYNERDPFFQKFKDTFKQICKTWGKGNLQEDYFSKRLTLLRVLKEKRDKLNHPKEVSDISATSIDDLEKLKIAFAAYNAFFSAMMENFFIEASIPI